MFGNSRCIVQWTATITLLLFYPARLVATAGTDNCSDDVHVQNTSFEFSSPGYPQNYGNNMNCKRRFLVNDGADKHIQFNITSFVVEPWFDYVKFQSSDSGNFVLKVFANPFDILLTVYPSNNVTLDFITDASVSFTGFSYSVSAVSSDNLLQQYESADISEVFRSPLFITNDVVKNDSNNILLLTFPEDKFGRANCEINEFINDEMMRVTSLGFPEKYLSRDNCHWNFTTNETHLIQLSISSFHVETWFDYLKLEGEINATFLAFLNDTSERVLITGFPGNNINMDFLTDDSVISSGFELTATSVSLEHLLQQYEDYSNVNATIFLPSPVYLTSTDDCQNLSGLDILFLSVPNDTVPLYSWWLDFAESSIGLGYVNITEITAHTFTISWQSVTGSKYYNVSVTGIAEQKLYSSLLVNKTTTSVSVGNLTAGTRYQIEVAALNKIGESSSYAANVTTDAPIPANIVTRDVNSTGFTIDWTHIDGAISYSISLNNNVSLTPLSVPRPPALIYWLFPGSVYDVRIKAYFMDVTRTSSSISQITSPGKVINLKIDIFNSTAKKLSWTSSYGAVSYNVTLSSSGYPSVSWTAVENNTELTNLRDGTSYIVQITAMNNGGSSVLSSLQFTTAPSRVTNLAVENLNSSTSKASWIEPDGATSYLVLLYEGTRLHRNVTVTTNTVTFSNLQAGTKYRTSLAAINIGGLSDVESLEFVTIPAKVIDLKTEISNSTTRKLSWTSSYGAVSYNVTLSSNENPSVTWTAVENNTELTNLRDGTLYIVQITAMNNGGSSEISSLKFTTAPSRVTNLAVENLNSSTSKASWIEPDGSTSYLVLLYDGTRLHRNITVTTNTVTFSNLQAGTKYRISLAAINIGGLSDVESLEFVTIPAKVIDLKTEISSSTTRKLSWTSSYGAVSYNVTLSSNEYPSVTWTAVENNTELTNLRDGTSYIVQITAVNNGGSSEISSLQFTTAPSRVTNLAVENLNSSTSKASWIEPDGATSYLALLYEGTRLHRNITLMTNTVTFGNLQAGTKYRISLAAINIGGLSDVESLKFVTISSPVADLVIESISDNSVKAQWSPVLGIGTYKILLMNNGSIVHNATSKFPNITLADLAPGTLYRLTVIVHNDGGSSTGIAKEFITMLSSPGTVQFASVTKNSFLLKWDQVTGASHYVYACSLAASGVTAARGNATSTSIQILKLQSETRYICSVTAKSDIATSIAVNGEQVTAQSDCENDPCLNGGTCAELDTGFNCQCSVGYEGLTCENRVDWCASKTCAANATCTNEIAAAVCHCNTGFSGAPATLCTPFCKLESVVIGNTTLTFNETYSGRKQYSNQICPEGRRLASAVCTTVSTGSGMFISTFPANSVISVDCTLGVVNITNQVDKEQPNQMNLEETSAALAVVTNEETLKEEEVDEVTDFFTDVADLAKEDKDLITETVLTNVVNTADNLVETNAINLALNSSQPNDPESPTVIHSKEVEIKQKILRSLTVLAQQVVLPNDTNEILIETSNLILKVFETPLTAISNASDSSAITTWFSPVILNEGNGNANETTTASQPINISIPFSVFQTAQKLALSQGNSESLRISFFLHKTSTLFPSDEPVDVVIAVNVGDNLVLVNLENDIVIEHNDITEKPGKRNTSEPLIDENVELQCVFWDYDKAAWSEEGCCYNESFNGTVCQCDHLTNYAVIVSRTPIPADIALTVVSTIGCVLSISGLFFTLLIHSVNKEIRKKRATQIMMHICVNLLLSYLLFVIGISRTADRNGCIAIAAILHYVFLASWCWMVVYTNDMYRSLVKVFNISMSHYMTKCAVFAYGLPFVISVVCVSVAVGHYDAQVKPQHVCVETDNYDVWSSPNPPESAYIASNMCWLKGNSLYFGFLLPVGLMLVFNTVAYSIIIKDVVWSRKKIQSSAKQASLKDNLILSMSLSTTTGMTWIVGYFMLLSDHEVFLQVMSWLFAIFNASQGLVIFILTCVRRENMRRIWLEPMRNGCSSCWHRLLQLSPWRGDVDISTMSELSGKSEVPSSSLDTGKTFLRSYVSEEPTVSQSNF